MLVWPSLHNSVCTFAKLQWDTLIFSYLGHHKICCFKGIWWLSVWLFEKKGECGLFGWSFVAIFRAWLPCLVYSIYSYEEIFIMMIEMSVARHWVPHLQTTRSRASTPLIRYLLITDRKTDQSSLNQSIMSLRFLDYIASWWEPTNILSAINICHNQYFLHFITVIEALFHV